MVAERVNQINRPGPRGTTHLQPNGLAVIASLIACHVFHARQAKNSGSDRFPDCGGNLLAEPADVALLGVHPGVEAGIRRMFTQIAAPDDWRHLALRIHQGPAHRELCFPPPVPRPWPVHRAAPDRSAQDAGPRGRWPPVRCQAGRPAVRQRLFFVKHQLVFLKLPY